MRVGAAGQRARWAHTAALVPRSPAEGRSRWPSSPHKGKPVRRHPCSPARDANAFPAVASATGCCCETPTSRCSPVPLAARGLHLSGAALSPWGGNRGIGGPSASRDMAASPRAFSVSSRVLAGTGHCKPVAFASPSETFLPRAAFLLRACRHKHPPSLWFPGPPAACGWPSGALVAVTQPLTIFTLMQRPPHGSRHFARSVLPLAISFAGHCHHCLRTPSGVPPGPPSPTSVLGSGNLRRGGLHPRDARARTGSPQPLAQPSTVATASPHRRPRLARPESIYCVKIPPCAESRS